MLLFLCKTIFKRGQVGGGGGGGEGGNRDVGLTSNHISVSRYKTIS